MKINKMKVAIMGANNFAETMQDIVLPQMLATLRENAVISGLVNTSGTEATAAEKGDVVNVDLPIDLGTADEFVPGTGLPTEDIVTGKTSIRLDQHFGKQFKVTDTQLTQIKAGTIPSAFESAVKAVANKVNSYIYSSYSQVASIVTAGQATLDVASLVDADTALSNQLAPEGTDRYAALSPVRYSQITKELISVQKIEDALRNARAGEIAGFVAFRDQLLSGLSHTNGTARSESSMSVAAASKGDTVLTVSNKTGQINAGDVLLVSLADGSTESVVAASNASGSTLNLEWALKNDVADSASIVYANSAESYDVGLAFLPDFYMLVNRPLKNATDSIGVSANIYESTDPVTGLTMRVELFRDSQTNENFWKVEMLFGGKVVQPAYATRVTGA